MMAVCSEINTKHKNTFYESFNFENIQRRGCALVPEEEQTDIVHNGQTASQ
jgi:hypothetical protein